MAVDAQGDGCAITTSLGLGSGVWVPGYGVHLNSMMGEGELLRGLVAPGQRMGSMMSPLVALDDDGALAALAGAAGGSRIRPALVQCLLRILRGAAPAGRDRRAAAQCAARPGPARTGLRRRGDRRPSRPLATGWPWPTTSIPTSVASRPSVRSAAAPTRGAAASWCMAGLIAALSTVGLDRRPPIESTGDDPSLDLPAADPRDFTLDDAAELIGLPARPRGRSGLPVAGPAVHDRLRPRLRHHRPHPDRSRSRRGCGLRHLLARPARPGSGWSSTSCPTTSASPPRWRTRPGGTCCALGRESAYADWFDIDWSRGRILVPVLGDDQTLTVTDGELRYFDHRFPLAPGSWRDGDDPATIHGRQHYELVHWSRANEELNYRRFFAVTTLAGVRVEDPAVLDATHARVRDWAAAGVTGLRIDHPDGLVEPGEYLRRLRELAPDQWITVEKILEPGEELPATGRSRAPPATTRCAR